MSNLSMIDTADVSRLIGALELTGILPQHADGALEASVTNPPMTMPPMCFRIDDDALEASINAAPPIMTIPPMCMRIDDGALEASVQTGPRTMPPICRFIDDGALEASVQVSPPYTARRLPGGQCF